MASDRRREAVAAALRFLLLTGLRPGEIAGAEIGELADVENAAGARLIPLDA